jgi:hypothetical protein
MAKSLGYGFADMVRAYSNNLKQHTEWSLDDLETYKLSVAPATRAPFTTQQLSLQDIENA